MILALDWAKRYPTQDVEVTIPGSGSSGELVGQGSGSTSKLFIDGSDGSLDGSGLARRIRVRPVDQYGAIKIKGSSKMAPPGEVGNKTTGSILAEFGLRFLKVHGFTFQEIDGNESAILLSGCSNTALAYMDRLAYWGTLGIPGYTSFDTEIAHVMYRPPRIKNGDGCAIGTGSGAQRNFINRNLYLSPIYIGEEATWNFKRKRNADGTTTITDIPDKPHSDNIQEKGTFEMTGWSVYDSIMYAAYNCIFQLGGLTKNFLTDGNYLLGEDMVRNLQPAPPNQYCSVYDSAGPATFQIFNGEGIAPHKSRNSYAYGNMGAAVFANTAADKLSSTYGLDSSPQWTKITPKTLAQLRTEAPTPPPGTQLWAKRF
jgi:hypothetical protein